MTTRRSRILPLHRAAAAAVLAALLVGPAGEAQEARRRHDLLRQIRLDKFDQVLPAAMRAHGIDMWIVAMRENNWDPLYDDLGRGYANPVGYYVFTDRGGPRIERALLGITGRLAEQSGAYDIVNPKVEIGAFVAERDPKRIGINVSDHLGPADGLTHSLHRQLTAALGERYAARLVSAERLVADFRARRVAGEIVAFGEVAGLSIQLMERALSNEVITPGRTTLEDVAWWLQDRLLERGATSEFDQPSVYITGPEGIEATSNRRIVQPGDVVMIDWGIRVMNFGTDVKRVAYVLKPGETAPPASIQRAFDNGVRARDVVLREMRTGRTGTETLAAAHAALRAAGFSPIGFNQPTPGDVVDVAVVNHSVGNTGHGIGPSVAFFQQSQMAWPIHPTTMMTMELFVYSPIAEWGGRKLRWPLEDDFMFTDQGAQWLHPPATRVLVIR